MHIKELYEICAKTRDTFQNKGCEEKVNEVLRQLILSCFNNKNEPDTLPSYFKLYRTGFYKDELQKFLENHINLNIKEIELIKNEYVYGNTFSITLA